MHKTLLTLLVALAVAGTIGSCRKSVLPPTGGAPAPAPPPANPQVIETEPAILTGITKNISTNVQGYYEALPAKYAETDYKYPVIFYFHGGGQYGNGSSDLSEALTLGTPKLLAEKKFPPSFTVNGQTFSFIFIIPQFVKFPTNNDVDALVSEVASKYRIDSSRIYLSGFSLGAKALSNYAAFKPNLIAAIHSMGGLPDINSQLKPRCEAMVNARLPIWHFHNRDDSAWSYSYAQRYIDTLNSLSPAVPPLFTTFDIGEGKAHHDCWTRTTDPAYKENGLNVYEWLLQYKRGQP
jgi:predicted peptidase